MSAFETLAALCDAAPLKTSTVTVNVLDLLEVLNDLHQMRLASTVKRGKAEYPPAFLAAYDAMKEHGARWREGSTPAAAYKQWAARIKAGADPELILSGTVRYALYVKATGAEVKMAQTFFGPGEHYTPEWALPSRASPGRADLINAAVRHRRAPVDDFQGVTIDV